MKCHACVCRVRPIHPDLHQPADITNSTRLARDSNVWRRERARLRRKDNTKLVNELALTGELVALDVGKRRDVQPEGVLARVLRVGHPRDRHVARGSDVGV